MAAFWYRSLGSILLFSCCASSVAESARVGVFQNVAKQFPNKNGALWMFGIAYEIFRDAGYDAVITPRPARRLALSLRNNEVDIIFDTRDNLGKFNDEFIRSELPVALVPTLIYYDHRNNWQPIWPPNAIFKQKIGKSVVTSVALRDIYQLNVSLAIRYDAPVKMVNMGRIDYYIEHIGGMSSVSTGLIKTPAQGFTLKQLFQTPAYGFFQNTAKGKQLAAIHDAELLLLFQRGEYGRRFYANAAPSFRSSQAVDDVVSFINKNYPHLNVPAQPIGRAIDPAGEGEGDDFY